MCAIVGLVSNGPVNQELFDALTVLQHRGQDAAGIVSCDERKVHLRKGNGLVRDVFHTRHMINLKGRMGIAHVRYPTAGDSSRAEAQPFYVNSPYGICLGHNGNLTNTEELQEMLRGIGDVGVIEGPALLPGGWQVIAQDSRDAFDSIDIGPLSLNTLLQRLSVLSKAHELAGQPNPCRAAAVRELLARTRRAYARRGATPARKDALTREPLQALLDTCDDSLRGLRDRALLLFAWSSGGRRRSEVVGATVENTRKVGEDYLYLLSHSKTNQSGADRAQDRKPIAGAAALALDAWLAASGIRQDALFRRIRRGDVIGEPLAAAAVRAIVQERCRLAGIEGDFSAHSLRSGFVTEAGRQNVPLGDAMAMTGHASVATVMGYFRAGAAPRSRAARLLDTPTGDETA